MNAGQTPQGIYSEASEAAWLSPGPRSGLRRPASASQESLAALGEDTIASNAGVTIRHDVQTSLDSGVVDSLDVLGRIDNDEEPYQMTAITLDPALWVQPIDIATANWFRMLATDADIQPDPTTASESSPSVLPSEHIAASHDLQGHEAQGSEILRNTNVPHSSFDRTRTRSRRTEDSIQDPRWQGPTMFLLTTRGQALFDRFVFVISCWMDLFDPFKHFSSLVPRLALRNGGLLSAIYALSSRQIAITTTDTGQVSATREDALQYYNETLRYVRKALQHNSYQTSDELLATTLIISAFEMLGDPPSGDWARHLQGVFWIQKSQTIHGDTGGLRGAIWWAWLCQDVWAAFWDKRKVFSFWEPERTMNELDASELAARAVFLLARVVNFCASENMEASPQNFMTRIQDAELLSTMLDEWESLLTPEFTPLPCGKEVTSAIFRPIWIHPPVFAVSVQLHHTSRILLLLNRPDLGGTMQSIQRNTILARHADTICGIAVTLTDYASSTMCFQSLFIAGLCTYDMQRRNEIIRIMRDFRQRGGWPTTPLEDDLREGW